MSVPSSLEIAQAAELRPITEIAEHAGIEEEGNLPPFGTLLVDTILNYEYPGAGENGSPVADAREPGDEKFEAPPGQESPGG